MLHLHGFCTVVARFVFSVSDYVGRLIAVQFTPFSASGEQCQAELRFYRGVCVLQKLQQSRHGDGRFSFGRSTLRCGFYRFIKTFLELFPQLLPGILLDVRIGVDQQIGTGVAPLCLVPLSHHRRRSSVDRWHWNAADRETQCE